MEYRPLNFNEARHLIKLYHYAGELTRGKYLYGAIHNDEPIACTVFDDRIDYEHTGEFMACARNPLINPRQFQMSQLIAYSCRQLKPYYDLLLTYCEVSRGIGSIFKGASWNYNGAGRLYHEYWKAITPSGVQLACQYGLKSLEYPK